jgi:hypothetical protein
VTLKLDKRRQKRKVRVELVMEVADNSNFEVTVCKYDITQTIQREKKKASTSHRCHSKEKDCDHDSYIVK